MPDPKDTPISVLNLSRTWQKHVTPGTATHEDYNTGSLQRIAAATELMATNYQQMQRDLERAKTEATRLQQKVDQLTASNRALKGVVTKLKRQQK